MKKMRNIFYKLIYVLLVMTYKVFPPPCNICNSSLEQLYFLDWSRQSVGIGPSKSF